MAKTGILLINLGTPADPSPKAVGKYLTEFLMDPYVIDIPAPLRWVLVNLIIVPKRKHASSALYQKVWTPEGSPLLVHSKTLTEKLREKLTSVPIELAMRYGEPHLGKAVAKFRDKGIRELVVVPLYPQYSIAATRSSVERVRMLASQLLPNVKVRPLRAFYRSDAFLDAFAEVGKKGLSGKKYDKILFSFHGLPERHIRKTDPSKTYCFSTSSCCDTITDANRNCYRAQCYYTARELATRIGIPEDKYEVCFQSRLNDRWIKPYTDTFYETLPKQGVKRVAVISPSFVADCLETLEEIAIRGKEQFIKAGGEDLFLVPSLNSEDVWVDGVAKLVSVSA